MTFHFAPKAAAPATVIRSTLCEGGSEGGMIGGGEGIGCANAPEAQIMERPSIAQAASMAGYVRRISLLPWMMTPLDDDDRLDGMMSFGSPKSSKPQ
jgi:hypothetical protein